MFSDLSFFISRKLADEREKDKKNLFVCTYNPTTQGVNFVKNICLNVETKVETLGLLEHINLGTVKITDQFFNLVTFGTSITMGVRIFIRRIFPIQNESDERLEKVIVTEAKKGENLTHIDDCHVLVIQEGGHTNGLDFDKYIISKIREITVHFEPKSECSGEHVDIPLDPKISIGHVLKKLSDATGIDPKTLELFKCYSTKSMMKRPAEFPVEIESEKNLETLLEWCKEGVKTIFYKLKSDSKKHVGSPPSRPLEQQLEEALAQSSASTSQLELCDENIKPEAPSVEEDIMDTA